MTDVLNAVIGGAPIGCVFALLAVGLVLTYRTAGVFNLAFGAQACSALSLIQDGEFVPQFGEPGKPFICFETGAAEVPEEPEVSA